MADEQRVEEKKSRLLGSLDKGKTQIHLDARRPGVIVPDEHRTDFHLVLNLSYRFDPPDLAVSEWGIRQTLSFKGSQFSVGVPWSAVYAIASHQSREFWMYPDDMPSEILDGAVERQEAIAALAPPPEAGSPRAVLREVVMERDPGDEVPSGDGKDPGAKDEPQSPPRRGHLRVVK